MAEQRKRIIKTTSFNYKKPQLETKIIDMVVCNTMRRDSVPPKDQIPIIPAANLSLNSKAINPRVQNTDDKKVFQILDTNSITNRAISAESLTPSQKPIWKVTAGRKDDSEYYRINAREYARETREMLLSGLKKKSPTRYLELTAKERENAIKEQELALEIEAKRRMSTSTYHIHNEHIEKMTAFLNESAPTLIESREYGTGAATEAADLYYREERKKKMSSILMYVPSKSTTGKTVLEDLKEDCLFDTKPLALPSAEPLKRDPIERKASFLEKIYQENNRFAFFEDFEVLDKFGYRLQNNMAASMMRDINQISKSDFNPISDTNVSLMCWNLFVYIRSQDKLFIDDDVASSLLDAIEESESTPEKRFTKIKELMPKLTREQFVNLKAVIGHMRRLAIAVGYDFIQGLSRVFGPLLLRQKLRKNTHLYISRLLEKNFLISQSKDLRGNVDIDPRKNSNTLNISQVSLVVNSRLQSPDKYSNSNLLNSNIETSSSSTISPINNAIISSNFSIQLTELNQTSKFSSIETTETLSNVQDNGELVKSETIEEIYEWDSITPDFMDQMINFEQTALTSQDAVVDYMIRYFNGIFSAATKLE